MNKKRCKKSTVNIFLLFAFSLFLMRSSQAESISGTAFRIASGIFITNLHVANPLSCEKILIKKGADSIAVTRVLDVEPLSDLVLLQIQESNKTTDQLKLKVVKFRDPSSIRVGEFTSIYGFPLSGTLSSKGNFTTGVVSALEGMSNDLEFIQITNPIQPGNSGGPVLDGEGRVIGVVQSKLDSVKYLMESRDIAQNVNFAVSSVALKRFVERNKRNWNLDITYIKASPAKNSETSEIAKDASEFTYPVECIQKDPLKFKVNSERYEDLFPVKSQSCSVLFGYPISLSSCNTTLRFPIGSDKDSVNLTTRQPYSYFEEYSGDISRGARNGKGILLLSGVSGKLFAKYIGDFKDNLRNGSGLVIFADGTTYSGTVKNGSPEGFGKYLYSDGSHYSGYFKDGKKNGNGELFVNCESRLNNSANCDKFTGQFRDDSINGYGTYQKRSGISYVGEWKDGELEGRAKEVMPSGSVAYDGLWSGGRKVK